MFRPKTRPRIHPWLAFALMALVTVRAGSDDTRSSGSPASPWRTGQPLPIAVTGGRCRFQVPMSRLGGATLVIVSALSKEEGPFPIRLNARGTVSSSPPSLAQDGSRRVVNLKPVPLNPVTKPVESTPPRERTFHMLVRDGDVASSSNYLPVRGQLRAVGQRVQVYVDSQDVGRVGNEVLRDVVATFDGQVFPVAARTIGQARDVDGDGRFTVLMSGWLTKLAGGRHAVDGFVRGADLDPDLDAPFSNHGDMMYLSASLGPGPHLRTILAHEYTHAVTYSAKSFSGPSGERLGLDEEGWLDEAIAHLGEDLHGFSRSNIDYRISAFLSQPEAYRLVVDDYYSADLFRSHGNRGGTYLFLRWCVDRYGPALLPTLIRSGRRGTENLEAATGLSFAALYRQWSTALFLTGLEPGHDRANGFRSLDVRRPLDGWELAGPRPVHMTPGQAPEMWSSVGTSSRYVVVEAAPEGAVEIDVEGPSEADLQVTAVPLPSGLPWMDLTVGTGTGAEGDVRVVAKVGERRGAPVKLSALAWEPLVPAANPHASAFRRGGLDRAAIEAAFGTSSLASLGHLQSRPIRITGARPGDGPIVIKAIGSDAQGRRVAAWAELNPTASAREHASSDDSHVR